MSHFRVIEDNPINPVFLSFADKETERRFINEYDTDNRIFFRIGIFLACGAWFLWYLGIYFSYRQIFSTALLILIIVLLPPFIFVVTLSYFKKYGTQAHNLIAYCNFSAACICIYVSIYLCKDATIFSTGIVTILFFGYFIIRIRFKISFIITTAYAIIGQYCVISSENFSYNQTYNSSTGIWLGFFIAMISGYFFERTNRRIFVQTNLITKRTNELSESLPNRKDTQSQLIKSEKSACHCEPPTRIAT